MKPTSMTQKTQIDHFDTLIRIPPYLMIKGLMK